MGPHDSFHKTNEKIKLTPGHQSQYSLSKAKNTHTLTTTKHNDANYGWLSSCLTVETPVPAQKRARRAQLRAQHSLPALADTGTRTRRKLETNCAGILQRPEMYCWGNPHEHRYVKMRLSQKNTQKAPLVICFFVCFLRFLFTSFWPSLVATEEYWLLQLKKNYPRARKREKWRAKRASIF